MADPVVPVVVAAARAPDAISLAGYIMMGLGALFILFLIYIFWKAQRDPNNRIDLVDLLADQPGGKTSQGRFWSLIAGTAGTWVFIYLPVSGHFDPTYASLYLGMVFAFKIASDVTGKPTPGASSSVTTTTSTVQAAAPVVAPVPVSSEVLVAAGRGVEPLNPKIGLEDVGKNVALVSTRKKPAKRKRK